VAASDAGGRVPLFRITSGIKVLALYGHFHDVSDVSAVTVTFLDLYDDASHDITEHTGGTDCSGVGLSSIIGKNGDVDTVMALFSSADGTVTDGTNGADWLADFIATAEEGTGTDICFNFTSDSGGYDFDIHWEIIWMPLSHDASVTPLAATAVV